MNPAEGGDNMFKKVSSLILILLTMVVLGACRSGDDNLDKQMKPILDFTSDAAENVKFVRTKEYDGRTVREFTDSKFYYEVTEDGRLMTIFLRSTPATTAVTMATEEEILLKSNDIIRRLKYDISRFHTDIKFHESLKQYESVTREKQGDAFTGNNIYMQYAADGTLISVSFKYENPDVLNAVDKITPEEAKSIIINYFSTNASTEKYASMLSPEIIRYEVDVYNNKKVYNLYFSLPVEEIGIFDFSYVVSTETGIILYRKEL